MKMSSLRFLVVKLALVAVLACSSPLLGQAAPASLDQVLVEQARVSLEVGDYQKAAVLFERLLKEFPASPFVVEAQSRLGYALFLVGDFEKSLTSLNSVIADAKLPAEVREFAASLLPQVLSAKAEKMPPGDARNSAYAQAVNEFDNFIQKFPASAEMESANYGKALALFHAENYEGAAASLQGNLKQFPKSESVLDTQYLLGIVYSAHANQLMRNEDEASRNKAFAIYDEAEKTFRALVAARSDVALANDAQFQLAEVLYVRGAQSAGEERVNVLNRSLEAYRSVAPKDEMKAAQQARINQIQNAKRAAAGNVLRHRQLTRFQEKEQAKLVQLEAKPDQTVPSRLRIGIIYFLLEKFDEARVVLRHMEPFLDDEQQKKEALYYKTFTYAQQNLLEKAVECYDAFSSTYKADPMAENMPVAIGGLYLSAGENEKAIELFKSALAIYPNGRFAADALSQQATALLQLKRYDEAKQLYAKSISGNAKKELAAQAQFGIANIDKDTGKIDEAIDGFKKVRETYPDSPFVEQSCFWIPQLLLFKQDAAGAVTEFQTFVSKYPESKLLPSILLYLAQAQQQTGNKDAALATLKDLAEKHAASEPAEFAYFQMAQIYSADQKPEQMVSALREFISKYPESKNAFPAYDTVAQSAANSGNLTEAVAAYLEFAQKQPKSEQAPTAMLKAADLELKNTNALGRYIGLNEQQRTEWDKRLKHSIAIAEKLIQEYPESQQVSIALKTILEGQKLFVTANLKSDADIQNYFQQLADKFASIPGTRTKVLFTYASFVYEQDKAKGLAQMASAFDPNLVYAPADLDLYGSALIEAKKLDEAQKVYAKVASDYANPEGVTPDKAPGHIMEAQSIALYGQGKVLQEQGKNTEAGAKFDLLKQLYPWSPKVLEATYGIALADFEKKDFDKASASLGQIIRAPNAPAELRAQSMLLVAKIHEAKGNIDAAIDSYGKIAAFYDGIPAAASEGLYKAGELIEKQLPSVTDEKKKAAQKNRAIRFYKDLTEKYPTSPLAPKASERLNQLGPAK